MSTTRQLVDLKLVRVARAKPAPANAGRARHRASAKTGIGAPFDPSRSPNYRVLADRSGWRPVRLMLVIVMIVAALVLGAFIVIPKLTAPLHTVQMNGYAGYPAEVMGQQKMNDLPQLGTGVLSRVVRVVHRPDGTFLFDPITGGFVRPAADDELEALRTAQYAVDSQGQLPDHQLAVTFDDGPDPRNTPAVLDTLSRNKVPATFFNIGENVLADPALFQRMIREGHMVGNHTLSHIEFDSHGPTRDRWELSANDHIMRSVGGYATQLWRLPYGGHDDVGQNGLGLLTGQQMGYVHVTYDIDTNDWRYSPGQTVPIPPLDGHGHVLLLHDGGADHAATIALLQSLIDRAKSQGYTFTTVAPLLRDAKVPAPTQITPSWSDEAVTGAMWSVTTAPSLVMSGLFWIAVLSFTFMSLLYIGLAGVYLRHRRRLTWPSSLEVCQKLSGVTVVISAFREEKVIRATLMALRRTQHIPIEIIIVDDGSPDGTWKTLEDIKAGGWPNLTIIRKKNGGKASGLNLGIARAKYDYIVTLDADTKFDPDTIFNLARHLVDPKIGVVAGNVKVDNRYNPLSIWQSLEYITGIVVQRAAESVMGAIMIAPGACAAYRKDAILAAGGFSSRTLAEDCDLNLAIARLGYRVVQENDAVAFTQAPLAPLELAKQRFRWSYGTIQALWINRGMMLRPKYGLLGCLVMPYAAFSIIVPTIFMPVVYAAAIMNLLAGSWQSVAIFAGLTIGVHMLLSAVAIKIDRERWYHLLVVPIYRVVWEPMRIYIILRIVKVLFLGNEVHFFRPRRTDDKKPLVAPIPEQALTS